MDNQKMSSVVSGVRKDSFKAWILAIRPGTLIGAIVPVLIGGAMAVTDYGVSIHWVALLFCFIFAILMQIDANLVNDYFDGVRGNDEHRLGPRRACSQGWIGLGSMRKGIACATILSCQAGLPLLYFGGFKMLIYGVLCLLACFLYTTCLSYWGLGDALVLIFFGLIPVTLTYVLCRPLYTAGIPMILLLEALTCGLVTDALLVVNNFRDISNDVRCGKRTLVVRLGEEYSLKLYFYLGLVACLVQIYVAYHGFVPVFLFSLIYLFFHLKTYHRMKKIRKGKALNQVLLATAKNIFIYGICISLGFLSSMLF